LLVLISFLAFAGAATLYYIVRAGADSQQEMDGIGEGEVSSPKEIHSDQINSSGDNNVASGGDTNQSNPAASAQPAQTSQPEGDPDNDTPLIAIDPGHGGVDGGSGRGDVLEKEVNLEIAKRLAEKLEDMGYEVFMIREDDDTTIKKEARVENAIEAEADIYISIHQNIYEEKNNKEADNDVNGIETYYCDDREGSKRLAQLVQSAVSKETGARDRGLKETKTLYVVREATMPSCLVECCFLSNKKEREAIVTEDYQEKLATGMATAIQSFLSDGE